MFKTPITMAPFYRKQKKRPDGRKRISARRSFWVNHLEV